MWGTIELNAATAPRFHERLAALRADSPRQWGKMSPATTMVHLCETFDLSLGVRTARDVSNWFTRNILFHLVFRLMPMPRNIAIPAEFLPAEGTDFEAERQALGERIAKFLEALETTPDRVALNPGFGMLTLRQWSRVHGKHLDHHLRQFGV